MLRPLLTFVLLSVSTLSSQVAFSSDAETRKMVERLAAIERAQNPPTTAT